MTATASRIEHQSNDSRGIEDFDLYSDIARMAPAMLWVSNEQGAMIFLNERYLRFTGLTESEAKSSASWINHVHPEDRKHAMQAYVDALKEHRAFSVEYRLRRHDGVFRDVTYVAQPRHNQAGHFSGYIGATIDITERKSQEMEIRESNRITEQRSRELNLLYELKSDLQVCREVAETRPVLTKYCEQLFPQRTARILLHKNSRDLVEPFLEWGEDTENVIEMFSPQDCWALRKGKSHLERLTSRGAMCPNAANCNHQQYLCVPMTAFGETVGIFQIDIEGLDDTQEINAEADDLAHLCTMAADEIGTAIEELKLRARLQHQSTRDSLTHLHNRRYFMESLEREIYRAKHADNQIALLMLDLDHFKHFNDTHGHIGGDMVLRAFGKVLEQSTRGGDIACRYGGEEFAVLMLDCPPEGAMKRAEQIRTAAESIAIEYHNELLEGITASIGVACYPRDTDDIDELLSKADAALYHAKENGRNRVEVANVD